jgi:hypothetical protein
VYVRGMSEVEMSLGDGALHCDRHATCDFSKLGVFRLFGPLQGPRPRNTRVHVRSAHRAEVLNAIQLRHWPSLASAVWEFQRCREGTGG